MAYIEYIETYGRTHKPVPHVFISMPACNKPHKPSPHFELPLTQLFTASLSSHLAPIKVVQSLTMSAFGDRKRT